MDDIFEALATLAAPLAVLAGIGALITYWWVALIILLTPFLLVALAWGVAFLIGITLAGGYSQWKLPKEQRRNWVRA